MKRQFTLLFWVDNGWYVGKLKEVPGIVSQGETLEELETNILDAYQLMMKEEPVQTKPGLKSKDISVEVM